MRLPSNRGNAVSDKMSFAKCAAQRVVKKNVCGVIFFVEWEMKSVFSVCREDLCNNTQSMIFSFISVSNYFCRINESAAFYSRCSPSQNINCGRFSLVFSFNPSSLRSCCLFHPLPLSFPLSFPFPHCSSLLTSPSFLPSKLQIAAVLTARGAPQCH